MSRIGLHYDEHGPDTAEVTIRRMAYLLDANERRYRTLWRWAHDRLPEDLKTEFFNIVANGSPSTTGNYLDGSKPRTDGPQAVGRFTTAAGVEVDYLIATEQTSTPFLEVPPDQPYVRLEGPQNGITSITRHKLA